MKLRYAVIKFPIFLNKHSKLSKHFISGIMVNSFGFLFYVFLIKYLNFSPINSLTFQYPITILLYFLIQNYFVFRIIFRFKNFIKFLLNVILLYILNILILTIFIEIINLNAIISQFYSIVLLGLLNYTIQDKIVFKNK